MSDTSVETWRRFRANSPGAADALFERYVGRLTALARSRLSPKLAARLDAEDVVQSAYLSFFRRAGMGDFTIAGSGDLWRLLAVLTIHKLQSRVEHHSARKRTYRRDMPLHSGDGSLAADQAVAEFSPSDVIAIREAVELLLAGLEAPQAQAVQMRLDEFSVPEIAAELGCSERTVRRWLHAAKRLLEAQLGAEGSGPLERKAHDSHATLKHDNRLLRYEDYVLQRHIGTGGTGRVYAAADKRSGAALAIKVLKKSYLRDAFAVDRFRREAHTHARLIHPRIVAVHGLGKMPGGGYFIAMQLVRGRSLADLIASGGLSCRRAAEIVGAVADAIGYAHSAGVIHCDLKPGNVLVAEDGVVLVTDFGMARALVHDGQPDLVAGTAAFMAPEQVDAAWGAIDRRTDIFGLGGLLYFALTGSPPHAGLNRREVLNAVQSARPVGSVSVLRPDVTPGLAAICMRCLAKSQVERFATAAEVASALYG
jgi:RNA polymerase sigma factor (sigma-70 family)